MTHQSIPGAVPAISSGSLGSAPRLRVTNIKTGLIGPLSLSLAAGACTAVLGPSGSGKSLLLRAIADLDPNQGDIQLDGRARATMSAPAWRRLVAYVPAETGWWDERVGDHFTDRAAAVPLIERLGLPAAVWDWSVGRLSTGERQRLGLARALALRPRVLLLDEPTSGLDDAATRRVETVMLEQRQAGVALVWVTHDEAQADRVADRRLRLDGGRWTVGAEPTTALGSGERGGDAG